MYSRYCKMFMMICSILIAGILFSCNDYSPIFASIENEEMIKTSNLSDGATTLGMAKLNNTYYVATGGAMYQRNIDAKDWNRTSLPSSYEGVSSLVQVNKDTAYVILVKDFYVEISGYALYRMENTDKNVTFSHIRTVSTGDGAIERLFAVYGTDNVNVYAAVYDKENRGYRYYQHYQKDEPKELQGGCKGSTVCNDSITGVAKMNDVVYISTQTELFKLQSDTDTLTKVPVKVDTTSLESWIGGIYYSELYKKLYLSNGPYIWTLVNEGAWKRSSKKSNTFFTSFIDINQTGFNGVLVGTRYSPGTKGRDAGYREIKKGDIGSISTPIGNKYTSGNLDITGVSGFFLDLDGSTLFVFTLSRGLWRGTYTNGRNIDWFLE